MDNKNSALAVLGLIVSVSGGIAALVILGNILMLAREQGIEAASIRAARLFWIPGAFAVATHFFLKHFDPEKAKASVMIPFVASAAGVASFVFFVTTAPV